MEHATKTVKEILLGIMVIFLLSGCGKQLQSQPETAASSASEPEVSIRYHASDGEYDPIRYLSIDVRTGAPRKPEQCMDADEARAAGRTVITFAACGREYHETQFRKWITTFNNTDDKYYVELIMYDVGQRSEAQLRIPAEVAAGGGPDILTPNVFPVNSEVLEKGALVDLTPYLEAAGITEENYFPSYASLVSEDGGIYGIATSVGPIERMMVSEKLLGGREVPDIATLVDKLLAYPEDACFLGGEYTDGKYIMDYLIGGSEDLWGMIDWEEGTCDFSGEFFSKMLETAKRYADVRNMGYGSIVFTATDRYELFDLEKFGLVMVDYYFDDGVHPMFQSSHDNLMINANTENLEGALAVLTFVMSEGGQSAQEVGPVNRKAWRTWQEYGLAHGERLTCYFDGEPIEIVVGEDAIEKLEAVYDASRSYPARMEKIRDIIYEEADSYFSGSKGKDEVIRIIQNRVQLYLDEMQ